MTSGAPLPQLTRPVPAHAGPRLLANLEKLVRTFREAVETSPVSGAHALRSHRALDLLEAEHQAVVAAVPAAQKGEQAALVARAGQLRFLARHMDGYRLDFAGSGMAQRLEGERRLVVLTACQIVAAAAGSGASGL